MLGHQSPPNRIPAKPDGARSARSESQTADGVPLGWEAPWEKPQMMEVVICSKGPLWRWWHGPNGRTAETPTLCGTLKASPANAVIPTTPVSRSIGRQHDNYCGFHVRWRGRENRNNHGNYNKSLDRLLTSRKGRVNGHFPNVRSTRIEELEDYSKGTFKPRELGDQAVSDGRFG